MATASFIGNEYATEQAAIDRRRKLAEALFAQSQESPQGGMVGQVYVGASPLQHLAQLLKGQKAQEMMAGADSESRALGQRQMADYQRTMADVSAAQTPEEKIAAMLRNPATAQQGMALQAEMMKPQNVRPGSSVVVGGKPMYTQPETPKFSGIHYDQNGNAFTMDSAGNVKPLQGVQQPRNMQNINGVFVDTNGAQPGQRAPQDPNKPFFLNSDLQPQANRPYQQYEVGKAAAGASRQQTLVNTFTPASEEAQRDFMKGARSRYDALQSAPAMIQNLERAKQLAATPNAFVGSFGDKKMAVAQFLNNNLGTNINAGDIKNASELQSRLFVSTMENLKKMDAQPSQYQQQIMQDAFGRITTDPAALPAVINVFEDLIKQKVQIHNKEMAGAMERGVKFPYDPTIDLSGFAADVPASPKAASMTPSEKSELESLRKRFGVR